VVGRDGLVGRIPEPECLVRDLDVQVSSEVADGVTGGIAQVMAADRFHDHLDVIGDCLVTEIREGMPAAIAAPTSTRFVAGFAPAFLDHVFRVATRTAGDGLIGGKVAIVRSNGWMLHSYRITGGSSRGYLVVRVHLWCARCQVLGSLDFAPQWDSSA
jgi:hypothetical protein